VEVELLVPAPELVPLVSEVPAWLPELGPLGLVAGLVLGVVVLGAFGVVVLGVFLLMASLPLLVLPFWSLVPPVPPC